jgi:hypothetical protein
MALTQSLTHFEMGETFMAAWSRMHIESEMTPVNVRDCWPANRRLPSA